MVRAARVRSLISAVALALTFAIACASGGTARAAGKGGAGAPAGKSDARSKAKAAVARAQVDYKLGRFQDALEGYRRAYELYQAPLLLFDMGQCHRALGDSEKAIFFFEGYLREETKPEPERRHLAQDLIAEAHADLQHKMEEAAATAAPPPAASPARPVQLQATDMQGVVPASLVASSGERDHAEPAHRSIASRWWFWTAIGGACLVAAGAAVYYVTGEPRLVPPPTTLGAYDAEHASMSR
jgi:tetratricopeptide (TPR) repeat protein